VRSALLRLPSLLAAIVALGALAALARFRPDLPETPASLYSPVTTAFLQEIATVATWLLALLVVLLLLAQSFRGMRATGDHDRNYSQLPTVMRGPSSLRRLPNTREFLRPLIDEPRLLVVALPDTQPAPAEEQDVGSSNKPAAGAVAEPDPRPVISLLGPLTIHGGKRSRRGLRARALELIAFLALRREGAQRDEILEALWPGEDPNRSRHRLYQAARDARQLLGDGVASARDRYWLDRHRVRVDVDELDDRLSETRQIGSSDHRQVAVDERRIELLENSLKLFRAEPLSGCDYAWAASDIRRLRGTHAELLELVARARLETGDARAALEAAEHGLGVDALNECLWRLALEAEGELGLREAIERRYHQLQTLLAERLGLEPSKETRALYLRLLSQT
jgi:DNA-binding SARP family transcriptional activator